MRVWLILIVIILTACQSSETLGEAIQSDIPFNVAKVIHTEKVEDGEVILYITEQKKGNEPINGLAVAFMKKEEEGWYNAGNNHWDYKENPNMTVYLNTFYDYDKKGNLIQKIPVIFGKIENKSIQTVQVARQDGKYENAKLIYQDGEQYFIKLGEYFIAEGLNSKREVVERYEKKK